MQYAPIFIQKGYRITETYEVAGVTYHTELSIKSQGFALGMAGYDPIAVEIAIGEEANTETFSVLFPKIKSNQCPEQDRYLIRDGNQPDLYRFTQKGEEALKTAVNTYLEEVKLYQRIGRKPQRFTVQIDKQANQ